jgi:rubrerythrin
MPTIKAIVEAPIKIEMIFISFSLPMFPAYRYNFRTYAVRENEPKDYNYMKNITVEEAFESAIGAEKAAQEFFLGLEAKFSHNDEVSQLWKQYAEDEAMHARWLEGLKAKLGQEELSESIDEHTVQLLDTVAKISVEKTLEKIHDLEDAYELVNEIESGETNAIFRFLVDNFEADEKMRDFLRNQLNEHVGRLTIDLPPQFRGATARRKIKAAA